MTRLKYHHIYMSNVVIILNTIILLVIVIYLITTHESGTPPQTDDSISTKAEATTETESDDSETESDDSETESDDSETEMGDPGTCEITGTWAMVGTCNADGTAKYIQTYKESKPGACPSSVKADFKPCCYQKGDWKDITECKPTGKKTQKQTTINCAENFKTREVDCEYLGSWLKLGGCTSEGKQYYTRSTVNSSEPASKSEGCCYISEWGGWTNWSNCDGSNKTRSRSRFVVGCPLGTATTETDKEACSIPISSYFTETCADLGGGSDVISASSLDDCMTKCKNNTHGYGYICQGLIYGSDFCRVYNNKGLDHSTNICNEGLKTYTLN